MSGNFALRQEINLTLKGNGTSTMTCDMPSALQSNGLLSKALGVSSLYFNNTNIPVFIPELATQNTLTQNAGSTGTNTILGNTDLINATDYFVIFRSYANDAACKSIVQWNQTRNISPPNSTPDENSVFTTPYYYSFDFPDFISRVEDAILKAIQNITAVNGVVLLLDESTNTFNLSITDNVTLASSTPYSVEFSEKLIKLFPFQSTKTTFGTYKIKWQQLEIQLDTNEYFTTSTPLQDTIFPFDYVLINCNLPMIPVEFISNEISQIPLGRKVFFKFRKSNVGLNIYNFFEATNSYLFDKLHRFTQDESPDQKLRLTLILRTKKNKNYLEWNFPSDCEMCFDVSVFSVV